VVHNLQGAAAALGAKELHLAGKTLEESVRNGDDTLTAEVFQKLEETHKEVMASVAWLENIYVGESPDFPADQGETETGTPETLCVELDRLLERGSFQSADCFSRLKRICNGEKEIASLLSSVETRIDNYEYEEARQVLSNLSRLFYYKQWGHHAPTQRKNSDCR